MSSEILIWPSARFWLYFFFYTVLWPHKHPCSYWPMRSMLLSQVLCSYLSSTENSIPLDIHVSYSLTSFGSLPQWSPENPMWNTNPCAPHSSLCSLYPVSLFFIAHITIWHHIFAFMCLLVSLLVLFYQDSRDVVLFAIVPQCLECGSINYFWMNESICYNWDNYRFTKVLLWYPICVGCYS